MSYEVTDNELLSHDIEHIWCNIKTNKDSLLIGCIYRPPTSTTQYNHALNKVLCRAKFLYDKRKFSGLFIAGDFNHCDIEQSNTGGHFNCPPKDTSLDFIDTINSNYLTQHVLEPSFGSNFLDLVFTDDPTRIFEVTAGPPLGSINKMHLHASLT